MMKTLRRAALTLVLLIISTVTYARYLHTVAINMEVENDTSVDLNLTASKDITLPTILEEIPAFDSKSGVFTVSTWDDPHEFSISYFAPNFGPDEKNCIILISAQIEGRYLLEDSVTAKLSPSCREYAVIASVPKKNVPKRNEIKVVFL